MKKIFLFTATLFALAAVNNAQNTSPYWSLAGNSNATASSKLGTTNGNNLGLFTNNIERMRITTAGSVGIATANPLTKFHVNGSGSFGTNVTSTNATRALNLVDANAVMRILRVNATAAPAVELISRTTADGANVAYWDCYAEPTDASFRIRDRQNGSTTLNRLTVLHTNGNVGIGTTTPSTHLHVAGLGDQEIGIQSTDAGAHLWTLQSNGTSGAPTTFQIIDRTAGASRLAIDNSGNIGIGNVTPGFPLNFAPILGDKISLWGNGSDHYGFGIQSNLLQIHTDFDVSDIAFGYGSSVAFNETMRIKGNGYVGIGTSNPNAPLTFPASLEHKITLYPGATGNVGFGVRGNLLQIYADHPNADIGLGYDQFGTFTERMRIRGNGNVGIGTSNPTYKLSVNGTIQAKEVRVETGWADYVFDENYDLLPLETVASYIHKNKHLPAIPSAKEIQKDGVAVGEMQTKLMEKIEELTLYVIDLNERIKILEEANAALNQIVNQNK